MYGNFCDGKFFFKKKTYFVVALFLFLASPLEIIFVKSLGTPITIGFIDSVFKTNYNEAKEQITSNLGFVFFFIGGFILYKMYRWPVPFEAYGTGILYISYNFACNFVLAKIEVHLILNTFLGFMDIIKESSLFTEISNTLMV